MINGEIKKNLEDKIMAWRNLPDNGKKSKDAPEFTDYEIQMLIDELTLCRVKTGEISDYEEEIEHQKMRYQNLCNFLPQGYITLKEDGIIKEVNKTAEKILGLEAHHLVDVSITLFIDEACLTEYNDFFIKVMQNREPQKCSLTLGHQDESKVKVDIYGMIDTDIDDDSNICRMVISPCAVKDESDHNGNGISRSETDAELQELTESYLRNIVRSKLANIGIN